MKFHTVDIEGFEYDRMEIREIVSVYIQKHNS